MSYQDIADMAEDWPLRMRLIAAAAEVHPDDPMPFVETQIWRITGQPGWAGTWASAKAAHKDDDDYEAGADEAVITDQMIFDGIQRLSGAVRAQELDLQTELDAHNQKIIDAEAARQLDLFTKTREVEIANPIILAPEEPTAVQLPYTPPEPEPVELVLDPNAPPPAVGPFQEPTHE